MSAPCFDIFVLLNAEPGARAERDFPHAVRQRLSQLGKRTVSSSDWRNQCLRHSFPICRTFLNLSDVGHTCGIGRAARELVVLQQQLGLSRRDRRSHGYWLRSLTQFPGPG